MKKSKLFILGLTTLLLTGCGGEKDFTLKIVAPKGAPSLAFYDMAADPNFETSSGDVIVNEFGKKDKGMVVMEFYTGLRAIKKSNSNYRLARILTGGNLYLVSRKGHTADPGENDKVIAFGPGGFEGIPYLSLKKLYPQVKKENVTLLKTGEDVQGTLVSGRYAGQDGAEDDINDVDYVVIPQPALAGALKKLENSETKPKIISCLRDKAYEDSNHQQKWILQAGLFVHKDLYDENKAIFDERLAKIDSNIDTLLTDPSKVEAEINRLEPSEDKQKAKFKTPVNMISKISKNQKTPNGFGFISKEEWEKVDVNNFLQYLGETGPEKDFSSYIL